MLTPEDIRAFADVPLAVEAELDRKIMTVRELLRLAPGAVLKLPRSAGENVDLWIGGVLAGSGEIVLLEEMVGVRLTDFVQEP
jgi:flagellar motor switch protein FliN/FliY